MCWLLGDNSRVERYSEYRELAVCPWNLPAQPVHQKTTEHEKETNDKVPQDFAMHHCGQCYQPGTRIQ
jgi:hypothetical protein